MASKRTTGNIAKALAYVVKFAGNHARIAECYETGKPIWTGAKSEVSPEEAAAHREWEQHYRDLAGKLEEFQRCAAHGFSDRELEVLGYDHDFYKIYR